MKKYELLHFEKDSDLAQAAASAWLEMVRHSSTGGRPLCVALSGGRITKGFFRSVVEIAQATDVPLGNVHLFWADERCVPPDSPQSNLWGKNLLPSRRGQVTGCGFRQAWPRLARSSSAVLGPQVPAS